MGSATIEDEKLCNELIKICDVDILFGYSLKSLMDSYFFQQICAQHSACVFPLKKY